MASASKRSAPVDETARDDRQGSAGFGDAGFPNRELRPGLFPADAQSRGLLPPGRDPPLEPAPKGPATKVLQSEPRARSAKSASPHAGHRERLRERLKSGGPEALPDYELLELVLFGAIARGDTKPLAKALIQKFGSFGGVINAPEPRLLEVKGVGDRVIAEFRMLRAATGRLSAQVVLDQPVLGSWKQVLDHCRAAMAHANREEFRILFLDKHNHLIADEVQSRGTIDHTPVYVREVVKRALEVSATAIILVHNHPSGDPTPSRADVDMTKQIITAAKPLGIAVHDHLIIARDGHASFRNLGLM